jgi:glutamyl-tRNA reductase
VDFAIVGLSYKTAPLEIREQAYIPESAVDECLQRLIDREIIDAGILLSTCNRTELYAVPPSAVGADRLLEAFGLWPHQLSFEIWRRYAYHLAGGAALAQLFRVAAGLESMVLGEGQILGQLKEAMNRAQHAGALNPWLHIAVRGAIRAGKRVRHETELGRSAVSVSHAAVAQARAVLGALRGRGVLLVGAGTMSDVALRLLGNQGIGEAYVASRTIERAEKMARPVGARAIPFDAIDSVIARVDIIISSSDAPSYLFDVPLVERLQSRRDGRRLLILDIAVPRDVHPGVRNLAGVRLFNVDDLRQAAETNLEGRQASIPAAERIIEEEVEYTRMAMRARGAAPTVTALVRKAERIRDEELARRLAEVPMTDTRTREVMRQLAAGITAKFLHGPVRQLRGSDDPLLDAAVMRDAFNLGLENETND